MKHVVIHSDGEVTNAPSPAKVQIVALLASEYRPQRGRLMERKKPVESEKPGDCPRRNCKVLPSLRVECHTAYVPVRRTRSTHGHPGGGPTPALQGPRRPHQGRPVKWLECTWRQG